ncbi:MAG: ferritin-like domain-containing protein [Gemmiger sp.]|nr:ferritin-like domain-containing protein [Gemmiger sp.]
MKLTQKESTLLKDLQAQENLCVEKYKFYAQQAKDGQLKQLFETIRKEEEQHSASIAQVMEGNVPKTGAKQSAAVSYKPKASYPSGGRSAEKQHDKFLCTDSIATEKYVSSAYNNDLFQFASNEIRGLLNHIQTEEQNHAQMIFEYKAANGMS